MFTRAMFPLLYLPCHVSFRFTDILRGLIAQPIAWNHGYQIAFTDATVYQDRNEHDYLDDFRDEIPCYQCGHLVPDLVIGTMRDGATIFQDLIAAYLELGKHGIVTKSELWTIQGWIAELQKSGAGIQP